MMVEAWTFFKVWNIDKEVVIICLNFRSPILKR
ncbi:hypothetical protein A8990_15613 [Paenibacillus taihuensis]|uniref:Uncharacterized protein n=1 Tax=Paenibacillus taihuensis TaxID=1156355 RepID=A0A3D9Q3J3_9BACL|nr:hypothetical protein A8990_15613 [Paenibacillus taihuensis]